MDDVCVVSSSLLNVNTSSTPTTKEVVTHSELIACVRASGNLPAMPNLDGGVEMEVLIRGILDGPRTLRIRANLDYNVCLTSKFIEEIITIIQLCSEDFEFALIAEDGTLINIR